MVRRFLQTVFLIWVLQLPTSLFAAVDTIQEIRVDPSAQRELVLDDLPFKEGDVFKPTYVTLAERLLLATERYELVDTFWNAEEGVFEVRLIERKYFEEIEWVGDEILEGSRIERQCLYVRELINLSQERLSQITRCIVSELQGEGYLDANVILSETEKLMEIEVILGPRYLVSKIEIVGLEFEEVVGFKRTLVTEEGKIFKPHRVLEDTKRILKNLLKDGFYFAEVFQPVVNVSPATRDVSLQWRLTKGRRFHITFEGDYRSQKPVTQLLDREEPFPKWFLDEVQDSILNELQAEGYLDAQVTLDEFIKKDGTRRVTVRTKRGRVYRLVEPEIIGASRPEVIRRALRRQSELDVGESFRRTDYRNRLNDVVAPELYDKGYLDLEVRGVEFSIDRQKYNVQPIIYMSEGDQYLVESFQAEGVLEELRRLNEWIDLLKITKSGLPYNQTAIERLKNEFVRASVDQGYLDAKAEIKTTLKEGRVAIEFLFEAGPRYRIAQVIVRGAARTKEGMLKVESGLKPGDLYLEEEVRAGISRILRLGLARSLDIRVLEKDPETGTAFILIDLVEAARFRFEFGPGFGTLDGMRGVFKATYANILGTGRRLSLFAKANRKLESSRIPDPAEYLDVQEIPFVERRVSLEYFEPRVFNLPVDGRLTLANSKQEFPLYGITKNSFGAAADYAFNRHLNFTTHYDLTFTDPFNVARGENITAFSDEKSRMLTSVTEVAVFQFLNDEFSPTKGARTRLVGSLFHRNLGGDDNFWQATAKQDFYYPVWRFQKERVVGFALSLNAGFGDAMAPTREIPVQERFFLGGESSVRGFEDQGINPPGFVGGNSYFYYQTEVNIPLFSVIDFLGFFDAGNIYANNNEWKFWDLRYGAGVGLRANTPVGPLKIGYGFNLFRRRIDGQRENFGAFYFGVGVI